MVGASLDRRAHPGLIADALLYKGTFQTGEVRLLFSSAQVEFLRDWLCENLCSRYLPISMF
jgi:hypothetical protein